MRGESRHRSARGRSETDDGGAEPATVVPGRAAQLQGVQDGAVARQLVVLVEHVQAEAAVAGPVVHGLERDQGELLVDGELSDVTVLYAVRPAPEDLSVTELSQVTRLRLGQQDDVSSQDELLPGADPGHQGFELLVGQPEPVAVPALEDDAVAESRMDAIEVGGVDRQAAFVRLARSRDDPECQWTHEATAPLDAGAVPVPR